MNDEASNIGEQDGPPPDNQPLSPQLQRVLEDPAIAEAMKNEDRSVLYRALLKKRKKCSDPIERRAIDEALAQRRLFLVRVSKAPSMRTINGIGTKLYGRSDVNPQDGTYITTLFFCIVFLPIFPIAQYLVSTTDGTLYRFYAKVPMSNACRWWQRGAGLVGLAGVLAIVVAVFYINQHTTVQFVNDLDVPVKISMGDITVPLQSGGHDSRKSVHRGPYHVTVRDTQGVVVEEQDVVVPGNIDVVVYNVVGASPLYAEGVIYHPKNEGSTSENNPYEHYCGRRFIVRESVQYIFQDPPKQIQMSSGSRSETRWYFSRASGSWLTSIRVLLHDQKTTEAASLAMAVSLAEPGNNEAMLYAYSLGMKGATSQAMLDYGHKLIERAPDSIEAHRMYQNCLRREGRRSECLEFYRKYQTDHPDSAMAAYLRIRAEPLAEALKLWPEQIARFPKDVYMRRNYAWDLFVARRFPDALPQLEKIVELDPKHQWERIDLYARTLVAMGRLDDALALASGACEAASGDLDFENIVLYGRLLQLNGATPGPHPPEFYLPKLYKREKVSPGTLAWFACRIGDPKVNAKELAKIDDPEMRTAGTIMLAAVTDLEQALQISGSCKSDVLSEVNDTTLLLLASEFARRGDAKNTGRLVDAMRTLTTGRAELKEYLLQGKDSPELTELDLELQAALQFAQGRKATSRFAGGQLYVTAQKDDILQGAVTRAMKSWPR